MTTATRTGRHVEITWVERGTRNAAGLGLDDVLWETDQSPINLAAIRRCTLDYAEVQGVDLDLYEPVIEIWPAD